MRSFDTMFARTALLTFAVGIVVAALLLSLQRQASLAGVRTFAVTIAELVAHDESLRDLVREPGPAPADWRDRLLAASVAWRVFSATLAERLGQGTQLEIRASRAGPIVWVHIPGSAGWLSRQIDLPRTELRGKALAIFIAVLAAVFAGAALLAQQLTGPLRRLAGVADRIAAGETPSSAPVGGPKEIRQVQAAFVRLCDSLNAAERDREQLLAGVSHDLRTPVNRMRFALGLHGEAAPARLVEELEHDLDELEQIAAQFITYARSSYEEPVAPVVLDDVVRAAIAARADAPSIDCEGGAPRAVNVEKSNVRRLVDNLLENAARHGAPPVRVRTAQTSHDVTLIVTDGGAGIDVEHHATALAPFARLAAADTPGSGLGLAIVERIARRHGGRVAMARTSAGFEVRVTLAVRAHAPA